MDKPLISVVIPSYNYADVLPRSINSVLPQLSNDADLLVVDDGSTDDTEAVINKLLEDNAGVFRYISQENAGPAAARNSGINATRGCYLIFLDADDELTGDALSLVRKQIECSPDTGMIAGGHISQYENGREKIHSLDAIPETSQERLKAYLLDKKLAFSNGAVAINRNVFENYRYPEKFRSSEDIPVFTYILASYTTTAVDAPLVVIHKHSDSLRHHKGHAQSVGLALVDEVFSPSRIPSCLQYLKRLFFAQRALSLFRTFYLAGDMPLARQYFHKAIATSPKVIFKVSYLRRYMLSWFKG